MTIDVVTEIRLFFEIVGAVTISLSIVLLFVAIISWILGAYPLFLRLGFGRWSRKISIAADNATYASLKNDLIHTGVFREKNISSIEKTSLAKIKESNLVLVHYQSFTEQEIKTILANKNSNAGMIVYFPNFSNSNRIPDDIRDAINNEPFTTTVNFRGRLINDILITLLSTSYEKK